MGETIMKRAAFLGLAGVIFLLAHSLPAEAHFRGGVSIGIGPVWGPGWWGPSYPYPYYSYPYPYAAQPVIIRQEPQYLQLAPQPQQQQYWYYCPDPQGYYPYLKKCPKGWLKVVPTPTPQEPQEPQE
jgi:hypothetical protein